MHGRTCPDCGTGWTFATDGHITPAAELEPPETFRFGYTVHVPEGRPSEPVTEALLLADRRWLDGSNIDVLRQRALEIKSRHSAS